MRCITKLINLLLKKNPEIIMNEEPLMVVVDSSDVCKQGTCLIGKNVKKELFNDKEYIGKCIQLKNIVSNKTIDLCIVGETGYGRRTFCNIIDLLCINCDSDLDVVHVKLSERKEEEE